jgi:hypothetical protein
MNIQAFCKLVLFLPLLFNFRCAVAQGLPPDSVLRCGWFDNSTPGNATLTDRDGDWIVAMQGQHEAKGRWPQFKHNDWVHTGGGSNGYGCACLRVKVKNDSIEIEEIYSAIAKPLSVCRQDKTLAEPENPLK